MAYRFALLTLICLAIGTANIFHDGPDHRFSVTAASAIFAVAFLFACLIAMEMGE